MADPALEGRYPVRGLYQVLAIAAMCIQEQPSVRPAIDDIVKALKYLASQPYDQFNTRHSPSKFAHGYENDDITKLEDE